MFKNTKLTTLVMLALGAMVALIMVQGLLGSRAIQQGDDSDEILYAQNTVPLKEAGNASIQYYRAWTNTLEALLDKDPRDQEAGLNLAEKWLGGSDEDFGHLDKAIKIEAVRDVLAEVKTTYTLATT